MTDTTEILRGCGSDRSIEIVTDTYGISHIYAETDSDAFFGQGFVAARDRLWQIDLWRKRYLGLLARDFGPAYVEQDRAARLFLYRGDMEAEWASYGADARQWTGAFVAGINAYVRLVRAQPERLPVEFMMTGTEPDEWRPADPVLIRAHARARNLETEVQRANLIAEGGLAATELHKRFEPPWTLSFPDGYIDARVPEDVMRTYRNGTAAACFENGRLQPALDTADPGPEGSNSWALAPRSGANERAILATDPHRAHQQPSLRYTTHLISPGLNVIGAGEPCVPGISLGHNEHIAFGLTIFPVDQEDLYVYELHPDDPGRYRYGDGWESMRMVATEIEVRGEAARSESLAFTRHGPVLHVDIEQRRAYALATVWSAPGTAPYMACLAYIGARDWEGFTAALEGWGAPSVNQQYADTDGNIGWVTAGKVPVRPTWDGLLPVPGDGRHEWDGFMVAGDFPREFNPARGWVASANEMNLPPEFDNVRHKVGFEWSDRGRIRRIRAVLDSGGARSVAAGLALQEDVLSPHAPRLCALLDALAPKSSLARAAIDLLGGWDHQLTAVSSAAALFEIWLQCHLFPKTVRRLGSPAVLAAITSPDFDLIIDRLTEPDAGFGDDPRAARDALLLQSLEDAMAEANQLLGTDRGAWAWGTLHTATFVHPLSGLAGPMSARTLDVGPFARGGDSNTVGNNGAPLGDLRVLHGSSWRMVCAVGDWNAARTINPPGQSGDPRSPHYRDHGAAWACDETVPLLYSRDAVMDAAERVTVLEPE